MYFPSVNVRALAKLGVSSFSCLVTATGMTMAWDLGEQMPPCPCKVEGEWGQMGAPVRPQVQVGYRQGHYGLTASSHCPWLPPFRLPPCLLGLLRLRLGWAGGKWGWSGSTEKQSKAGLDQRILSRVPWMSTLIHCPRLLSQIPLLCFSAG